jgi:hypothetical protein
MLHLLNAAPMLAAALGIILGAASAFAIAAGARNASVQSDAFDVVEVPPKPGDAAAMTDVP